MTSPAPRTAAGQLDGPAADPDGATRHLITAAARATAILRTCQFTAEHWLTLDHALACRLLEDEGEGTIGDAGGHDILSLARTLEARLAAAEIYITQLSDIVIAHVLADPAARPSDGT